MQVIPGYQFADEEKVELAKLNLLGHPTVLLEDGDIGPDSLDMVAILEALGSAGAGANYLQNGNFAEPQWARGSTAVSCPAGLMTLRADYWWCRPADGPVDYLRQTGGADHNSNHSARINGATGAGIVQFGQDIPAHIAAALAAKVAVTVWIYNGTGSTTAPKLRITTANATNDFTSVATIYVADGTTPPASGWTKHTWLADLSAYDTSTGVQCILEFPAGTLNGAGHFVYISQAKLELGETATQFVVERDAPGSTGSSAATGGGTPRNIFENGAFLEPSWYATSLTCGGSSADNFPMGGWWVNTGVPSGLVASQEVAAPNNLSLLALKLLGATGISAVSVGQNVPRHIAVEMRRPMVFSCWVYNSSGAAVVPKLRVDTCATKNDFSSVGTQVDADLQSCANGAWTQVSYPFDGTLTNMANGARVHLRFPDGTLASGTQYVQVAQMRLEPGSIVADYNPATDRSGADIGVPGTAETLTLAYASANTLTVAATNLILASTTGRTVLAKAVSCTVDINSAGAINKLDTGTKANDTWYYVWAISDGTTTGAIASQSATTPTVPTGYQFKALIGAFRTGASTAPIRVFRQVGRRIYQVPSSTFNNHVTTAGTWQAVTMTSDTPPIARAVWGSAGVSNSHGSSVDCNLGINSDANGVGEVVLQMASTAAAWNNYYSSGHWETPISETQKIYIRSDTNTTKYRVEVCGYEI